MPSTRASGPSSRRRKRRRVDAAALLIAAHVLVLLAGPLAPYHPAAQHREAPWAPPTRIHFFDAGGGFHPRPFVYARTADPGAAGEYVEDRGRAFPIRFFVRGEPYALGPWTFERRLFGVEAPARIFLLGTDGLGRDQLARLLHGGRVSLFAGLLAAAVALSLGTLLGSLSGFYGGRVDALLMRMTELVMVLPWLYLLLAVRAFLPLELPPLRAFVLVVTVIGLIGWAPPARLFRGVALSAREREYVQAARGFGAGDRYLLVRHILPQVRTLALTQAAILAPRYILAEVTLSFLGLGIGEPVPSWGNLLAELQHYSVLASYWWMAAPAVALVGVFLLYQRVASGLAPDATIELH